jgi:outer membrane receptor protein involved in Fe transport
VPFDFYKTVEVKTGGYSAEFGRGTGGVVNAVTKSGSNDFMFAVHGNYEPDKPARRGAEHLPTRNHLKRSYKDIVFEAGGPIIKDHLFFYGLNQFSAERLGETKTAPRRAATTASPSTNDPAWGIQAGRLHHRPSARRTDLFRHHPGSDQTRYAYAYSAHDTIGAKHLDRSAASRR